MRIRSHKANEPLNRKDFPKEAVWFFDFDGVIATQDEESVFRLEALPFERPLLERMAVNRGIVPELFPSTEYLRHVLFQMELATVPVTPNLAVVEFIKKLEDPFYIITARSAQWAVHRASQFILEHRLRPQEIFCLGQAEKAVTIGHIREIVPDRPFVFLDDSEFQVQAVAATNDPNMDVVRMWWPSAPHRARHFLHTVLHIPA